MVAIWREGRAYRSFLGSMKLRFGDALLLYGERRNLGVFGDRHRFPRFVDGGGSGSLHARARRPFAVLIMVAVLLPVILGWLSIAISAIAGVVLMILTGCIDMEEAYQSIEWKAIFLIAGMLPLGIALERTGAAGLLARAVVDLIGGLGPMGVLAGLFVLAGIGSAGDAKPAAVAVLLAPVALTRRREPGRVPIPAIDDCGRLCLRRVHESCGASGERLDHRDLAGTDCLII